MCCLETDGHQTLLTEEVCFSAPSISLTYCSLSKDPLVVVVAASNDVFTPQVLLSSFDFLATTRNRAYCFFMFCLHLLLILQDYLRFCTFALGLQLCILMLFLSSIRWHHPSNAYIAKRFLDMLIAAAPTGKHASMDYSL